VTIIQPEGDTEAINLGYDPGFCVLDICSPLSNT